LGGGGITVLSSKTMDEVELEDSGRGLICKDPINMGNALFQLPLKIVIDKDKALEVRAGIHARGMIVGIAQPSPQP